MKVETPANWESYCRRGDLPGVKIIAHPGGQPLRTLPAADAGTVIAVGPEGGFSEREIAIAAAADWRIVNLGPRILRVETAALALASCVALCR
jgi:16S rRNA (uracil1498-N3)-methyltransferase